MNLMGNRNVKSIFQYFVCHLFLIVHINAFAQPLSNVVPDVIVQSGRLEQKRFDAPASIYTIDAETIRNSGPQVNLSDALAGAPGVVALNRNNYAQDVQISIRGFGARSAFGIRGIRLITDGIPGTIPDGQGQASTVSMTSADRIEILTGPLAQLYGNSAGGVIQTFTREAGDKPVAESQFYVGSYGMARTDWQFSQRTGNVGIVADYSTFAIKGYRDNSDTRRQQLNTVVTVDTKPGTRIKLIANIFDMPYAKDAIGLTASGYAANPKDAGNYSITDGAKKIVSQNQFGAVLDHKIQNDLQLQARVYTGTRTNLQYQARSTSTASPKWTGLDRHFGGMGVQLKGKERIGSEKLIDWIVGYDQDSSTEQRQAGGSSSGVKIGSITRNELNQATNSDLFTQINWHLIPKWTFTSGIRQSSVQLKSQDYYLSDGNGSGSVTYKATNPVLGATWHFSDSINIYLNHGKGLETPTLSESAYTVNGTSPTALPSGSFNSNLLASRSQHIELGTKWLPSNSTRIDAAWFRIKTANEIVTAQSSGGTTAYTNAAETLRQGFELATRQQFSENWHGQLSASYIRAIYENYYSSYKSTYFSGNTLPGIPNKQLFSSIAWSEKGFQSNRNKPTPGTLASLDWIGRSVMWADDSNLSTSAASGYSIFNARLREILYVGPTQIEAYLGINNVTDQKTVSSVIINQSSSQYFEPGLPRNWVVGLIGKLPLQ
jgi:iron complex outermembrane receptor protein